MYLIAGLGNPGTKYHNTRHNIGFMVIDKLADFFKTPLNAKEELFMAGLAEYNDEKVVLLKPMTYMNLSGRAVKDFSERFEVPKEKILVVYDDVNLEFGTLRTRPSGSDGGQNGIKSVIFEFESEEIPRLRIGIKTKTELEKVKTEDGSYDLAEYVLDEFSAGETKDLDKIVTAAKDAVLSFVKDGIGETMNNFNKSFLN